MQLQEEFIILPFFYHCSAVSTSVITGSVNISVGVGSSVSAVSISVVTGSVNTKVGAISAASPSQCQCVTVSVNTNASVGTAVSALSTVTSLSVFQYLH